MYSCEVVIATRNRPEALHDCLVALGRQSESNFRIVVVDDSSDVALVQSHLATAAAPIPVTLIRLRQQSGPAAARNAGVTVVRADYLLFIDDDVCASPELIAKHLARVRSSKPYRPVVSCGPFVEPDDWNPTPWNKWEAVQAAKEFRNLEEGVHEMTWRQFHTGNNCLPTELFRRAGGFDDSFKRAEDDELAFRLARMGCRFEFERDAIGWHYAHRTLQSWLEIPRAYAKFDISLDRKHPDSGYLAEKQMELDRRHSLLRFSRRVFDAVGPKDFGIRAWVRFARVLFWLRLERLSMAAFSAAYDLSYVQALHACEVDVGGDLPSARMAGTS